MLADLQARSGGKGPVPVPGDVRVCYYGLGPDAYSAHQLLGELNLVKLTRASNRDRDGTFVGPRRKPAASDGANSFEILNDGFRQKALATTVRALRKLQRRSASRGTSTA
jgi:hypothetical protein